MCQQLQDTTMTNDVDLKTITALLEGASLDVEEVLKVCFTLGKILQCIPKEKSKFAIAGITNKRDELLKKGHTTGHMMLTVVLDSWQDFANQRRAL